jgi:16S rRNA processing protein RimM
MGDQAAPNWDDCALVGHVARAHGIRGQVIVNPETDFVEERFREGAVLLLRRPGRPVERFVVVSSRLHRGRPVIALDGIETMNDAEVLAGLELRVPIEALEPLPPGTYYRHDLVGCRVETQDGTVVGDVTKVEGDLGASRLVVTGALGEVLVPLAEAICVSIDTAARRILLDPPEGLLEVNRRDRRTQPDVARRSPGHQE